ncbi:hypothetical protein D3C86_2021590 [compost metagenome]
MGAGVPFIHAGKRLVTLMHRNHRAFGQDIEVAIGNDRGHFDDHVLLRIESGHFQVDPDQVLRVLHVLLLG